MFIQHSYQIVRRSISVAGALFLLILVALPCRLQAQEEADTTAAEEIAEPELIASRLSLTVTQMPGDTIELKALLRAKIDGVYQKIADAGISFFAAGETDEAALGSATTKANGVASLKLNKKNTWINEEGYLTFSARFEGDAQLEGSDDELSILPATMKLEPSSDDSTFTIVVTLTAPSADGKIPLTDATVVLKVQRMVGLLNVGEGTTDEDGLAEITFPTDLSGDDKGNLYITALIEDFEEYGNLSAATVQPWGKPVSTASAELPRALWSPYPPAWLLITFLGLLAIIWGHYVHVAIELNTVKKAAKLSETTSE